MYKGKKILVTGGTGMIGRPLVDLLVKEGANVSVASLDDPSRAPEGVEFVQCDLRDFNSCMNVCKGKDYVFHLAGVKGSPKMTNEKPASFFVPTITFNTNMMEAAFRSEVGKYLFTSSIGVYKPAEVFHEDDVWSTFPSPNDRFAGWAKRMGELQAESYLKQYGWDGISIVRPANVYGPYDNFDLENCMVIPALIRRVMDGERPLTVWGDGSPVRDFIFSEDVARGMMKVMESGETRPVNLGSGEGFSIKELVETIISCFEEDIEVSWDTTKPAGDLKRLMDVSRAKSLGVENQVSLKEGILRVISWYGDNKDKLDQQYNSFREDVRKK
jgi:GDP-L-fucose synthase